LRKAISGDGNGPVVRDRFGRDVSDLRISLTQRCNLACVFCHMEGQPVASDELSPSQIEAVVRAGASVGINRVKLTGGEPTLRSDLLEIVRRIRPHVRELSMTTNGLRMGDLAADLKSAGLDRVNVSLPSLNPATYRELTGVDGVARTIAGIRAAVAAGLAPVKLNVVALEGATDSPDSVEALLAFAQEVGAWVQVIEFENVSGRVDPKVYRQLHSELSRLSQSAAARAFQTDRNRLHGRPRYTFESHGRPVTVEVVQPVENPSFCMACHRLRLTSDGQLKGCLMTNHGIVDLRPALALADPEPALVAGFERAIARRRPFFTGPETPVPSGEIEATPFEGPMLSVLAPH
ncbi:MAG: GTP 3',8-cyclase MoaA, partial [Thermoplasmata archaeon]|nr:GTP 3',8-cyclase MoaA [Thermoplasmata archaeon]